MRITVKAVLAVSLAAMCAGAVSAQEKGSSKNYDWEGTHEITFKAGLPSWELGLQIHNQIHNNSHSVSYHDSKTVYTPSFALEYGFNTKNGCLSEWVFTTVWQEPGFWMHQENC